MSGHQMDLGEVLERIDEYEARVGYSLRPLREVAEILAASSVPVRRPAFCDGVSVNFSAEEADVYIVCGSRCLEMHAAKKRKFDEVEPRWHSGAFRREEAALAVQACIYLLSGDEEGFRTWISLRYSQS